MSAESFLDHLLTYRGTDEFGEPEKISAFCKRIGISESQLRNWRNFNKNVQPDIVKRMTQRLKLSRIQEMELWAIAYGLDIKAWANEIEKVVVEKLRVGAINGAYAARGENVMVIPNCPGVEIVRAPRG